MPGKSLNKKFHLTLLISHWQVFILIIRGVLQIMVNIASPCKSASAFLVFHFFPSSSSYQINSLYLGEFMRFFMVKLLANILLSKTNKAKTFC